MVAIFCSTPIARCFRMGKDGQSHHGAREEGSSLTDRRAGFFGGGRTYVWPSSKRSRRSQDPKRVMSPASVGPEEWRLSTKESVKIIRKQCRSRIFEKAAVDDGDGDVDVRHQIKIKIQ